MVALFQERGTCSRFSSASFCRSLDDRQPAAGAQWRDKMLCCTGARVRQLQVESMDECRALQSAPQGGYNPSPAEATPRSRLRSFMEE